MSRNIITTFELEDQILNFNKKYINTQHQENSATYSHSTMMKT